MAKENQAQFDQLILSESTDPLSLGTSEENQEVAVNLVRQAKRTLVIAGRDLDAALYNNDAFCDAVAQLATRSKYSHIRMLIQDSNPLVQNGHCLLHLARRLTSFMEIRIFGNEFKNFNQAFLIVDDSGYIKRKNADRYDAIANFNDAFTAREMAKAFQGMWDESEADPQLRRLHV